jgi:hypothetical protein
VTTRTLQGMACVRSGQATAWPMVSDRSVRSGSRVKRDFACECCALWPGAAVAVGCCRCCHRCCQPLAAVPARRPFPPIGLTAAGLFAEGKVSRADSRVRWPGTLTCARCPAARSALEAVPEACHNRAAIWWGPLRLPRSSATRRPPSWRVLPGRAGPVLGGHRGP